MKRSILLCNIFVVFIINFAVSHAKPAADSIPFKFLEHRILVKGNINKSQNDYNFIIDTGGLTFIDKNIVQELTLKQHGMMAKIDTLHLSGFQIENIFCFTTFDFQHLKKLGIPIHGIIGSNLLERFKVTFDFKSCIVTISGDTTNIEPDENGLFLSFRNHPVNNAPLVKFTLNQKIMEGMIDTGHPYPLVLPLNTFEQHKNINISDSIKSKGLIAKWPMTSADHNYLTRLKRFELGNIKIENTICLFGELPPVLSIPLIGMDFLSQFEITINYPKDEMMMIPYHDIHFKNNLFSLGLDVNLSEKNEIIVEGLWENSPADKANIQVGDIIIAFNSQKTTHENLMDLRKIMKDNNIESINLEVKNQKGRRKIKLNKAMLF